MKRYLAAAMAALSLVAVAHGVRAADKPLVIENGQAKQLPAATALQLNASAAANESVNIGQGTAPSAPADGALWGTSVGLFSRFGGVTYGPLTLSSVTCGAPLTGGTITTTGTCGIAANGLALSYLVQIGGNSVLANYATTTGDVTAQVVPNCTGAASAIKYNQTGGGGFYCDSVSAVSGGTNPFYIGVPNVQSGIGAPSNSSDPVGSLYMRTDTAQLWQQRVASGTVPTIAQAATSANSTSVTLTSTPAAGDLLVAICAGYTGIPGLAAGWTAAGVSGGPGGNAPGDIVGYKFAVTGESTTQTPCTNVSPGGQGVLIYEVSGVASWADSYESSLWSTNNPVTATTANANDLVLGAAYATVSGSDPGAITTTGLSGAQSTAHVCCSAGGVGIAVATAAQAFAASGSAISFSRSTGNSGRLIILKPATAGWKRVAPTWKNAGTELTQWPLSINCSTGTTCTTDGLDNLTVTAAAGTNSLALTTLAQQSANTVLGNFTGSTANVTANAMPGCADSGGAHLNYVAGTGVACGTSYNASPTLSALTLSGITGSTQCLHVNTSGSVSGTGADCGAGGGGTVTTTGAPASGQLAKFSGATSITNATVSAFLDSEFCSTRGSILYRGASAWACLGPATSGYSLTTQGPGADPTWANVGGGGGGGVTQVNTEAGWTSGGPITSTGQVTVSSAVKAAVAAQIMANFGGL